MNEVLRIVYEHNVKEPPTLCVYKDVGLSSYCVAEFKGVAAIEMFNRLNQGNPLLEMGLSGE